MNCVVCRVLARTYRVVWQMTLYQEHPVHAACVHELKGWLEAGHEVEQLLLERALRDLEARPAPTPMLLRESPSMARTHR